MSCQKAPLPPPLPSMQLFVPWMSVRGGVGENSRPPALPLLICIRGRKSGCVQLPQGLTVGTESQRSPFVFLLLKGPAIVACRDPGASSRGSGAAAKTSPDDAQL